MKKNVVSNPFAQSLKAQMVTRFPGLQIEVNPRSAWVKGDVPADVQSVLKAAGFLVCAKGWYFTHECVKMPSFPTAQAVKAAEKPVKKEWVELPEDLKNQIVSGFLKKYPGCQVEVRGSWVFLCGLVFKTNEEYRQSIKQDGFHYGYKSQEWSRALTPEEMSVKTAEPAVTEKENVPSREENVNVFRTPEQNEELTQLRKIIIFASKGLLTHDEMIGRMKEVCPF